MTSEAPLGRAGRGKGATSQAERVFELQRGESRAAKHVILERNVSCLLWNEAWLCHVDISYAATGEYHVRLPEMSMHSSCLRLYIIAGMLTLRSR